MRIVFLALILLCIPLTCQAQQHDITGWWKAPVGPAEESSVYLHFYQRDDGRRIAAISLPDAHMDETAVGRYEIEGDRVRLPSVDWELALSADGATMAGALPHIITPTDIEVRFERSAPPPTYDAAAPRGDPPHVAWMVSIGTEVWAGLAYDRSRRLLLAAGDDGALRAIDARTGDTRWTLALGAPVRATPTLDDGGRAYIATDRSLVAVDLQRRTIAWRAAFGAERAPRLPINDSNSLWDHYGASAVVSGEDVFVAARDGCLYALRKRDGRMRWRECTESGIATATPALNGSTVFFAGFDGTVRALDRNTGQERWRADTGGAVPRDVALAQGNLIAGSRSNDLFAFQVRTGEISWRRRFFFSWIDSPPVYRAGRVFVGSSDALRVSALDPRNGQTLWSTGLSGWAWPSAIVTQDTVYAGTVGASQYGGRREGALAAIDANTGELRWSFQTEIASGAQMYGFASAPIVVGRRVFAADLAGRVYAFDDPPAR